MKKTLVPLVSALLLCSACSSITTRSYRAPDVALPAAWSTAAEGETAAEGYWWKAFNDAGLNALMTQVLAQNHDLAAAAIQLRRAQLQAGLAASNMRPDFGVRAGVSRDEPLQDGDGNTSYSAAATVSYEADLWRRLGSLRDSARWAAKASAEDLQSTALALTVTAANLYWQLGYLDQRVLLAEQSLADGEKIRNLVRVRYQAGAVSGVDSVEAEQNLAALRVELNRLTQQRVEVRNTLALLLATPGSAPAAPDLVALQLPALRAELPASLLAHRPDLRAAELRLRAAFSDIRATQASFYPTLTLTGSLGGASSALSKVISDPVATLGAGLVLPFLNWQEMRLSIKVSEADYEAAATAFRQRLLTAFTEVEDALSARVSLQERHELLQLSRDTARQAEALYEIRYRAGAVSLQDWLSAQEKRRAADIALATNQLDRLVNHATLSQALGGATALPAPVLGP